MLEVVDRAIGIDGGWPSEIRSRLLRRFGREDAMIRHVARHGPHDVERVKRRHPRARLGNVDPRVREVQPFARGADRDLQQQPLGDAPLFLSDQRSIEGAALLVEEQWILAGTLGHHAFGEARHEHDAKAAPAALMRRADEQAPVPPGRRIPVQGHQSIVQHVTSLLEADRTDAGHRPQFG